MSCWELGMGRAVAGGALQAAVADGKAIERETWRRRVGRGGKGLVRGDAHAAVGSKDGGVADLAVVVGGGAGVAALAVGFHEPADRARADLAHVAVAALALHLHRAVGRIALPMAPRRHLVVEPG